MLRSILRCLYMVCVFCLSVGVLIAADKGEEILVYSDGLIEPLVKQVKTTLSVEFKKQKIKMSTKTKKYLRIAELIPVLEKDVLKREPTTLILSLGTYDIIDRKKKTLVADCDLDQMQKDMTLICEHIQSQGMTLYLCTPGLYGEYREEHPEINEKLDAWSERVRDLCEAHEIGLCDLRADGLRLIEKMKKEGKYKKGKPYLTKSEIYWSKEGVALVSRTLQRACGVNQSGIGRKIGVNEYIAAFITYNYALRQEVEKIHEEVRALHPKPGPVLKVKLVKLKLKLNTGVSPKDEILNQRPGICFIQLGMKVAGSKSLALKKLPAGCEALMGVLKQLDADVFILTPPAMSVRGSEKVDREGKEYKKSLEVRNIVVAAAEKHKFPVIDIFTITDEALKASPGVFIFGKNKTGGDEIGEAYVKIIATEMRKALGLAVPEEE